MGSCLTKETPSTVQDLTPKEVQDLVQLLVGKPPSTYDDFQVALSGIQDQASITGALIERASLQQVQLLQRIQHGCICTAVLPHLVLLLKASVQSLPCGVGLGLAEVVATLYETTALAAANWPRCVSIMRVVLSYLDVIQGASRAAAAELQQPLQQLVCALERAVIVVKSYRAAKSAYNWAAAQQNMADLNDVQAEIVHAMQVLLVGAALRGDTLPEHMAPKLREMWQRHFGTGPVSIDLFLDRLRCEVGPSVWETAEHRAVERCDQHLPVPLDLQEVPYGRSPLQQLLASCIDWSGSQQVHPAEPWYWWQSCCLWMEATDPKGQLTLAKMVQLTAEHGDLGRMQATIVAGSAKLRVGPSNERSQPGTPFAKAVSPEDPESMILQELEQQLQVPGMSASYRLKDLVLDYVPETRTWLFEEVDAWLRLPHHQGADSRMLLLLGGPGMGKSTVAALLALTRKDAVMAEHFFKAQRPQGSGKAMVLSVLAQLAARVTAIRPTLNATLAALKASKEEPLEPATMSMQQCFDKLLLPVLKSLDERRDIPSAGVVVLLDALDEADDSGKGWGRVVRMIANSFRDLPSWFRILATSRPEVHPFLSSWQPHWIHPDDGRNMEDMRVVVRHKLEAMEAVEPQHLGEAVGIITDKSQGMFLYTHFALRQVREQLQHGKTASPPRKLFWSVEELRALLPNGMFSTYAAILDRTYSLLQQHDDKCNHVGEQRLSAMLAGRVLPVLAAAQDNLTVEELAWAAGIASVQDVQMVMGMLLNLFPMRPAGDGALRIHPFHKTVLDFLLPAPMPRQPRDQQAHVGANISSQVACLLAGLDDLPMDELDKRNNAVPRWQVDLSAAHAMYVDAIMQALKAIPAPHRWDEPCAPLVLHRRYALQHCLVHLAAAGAWAQLHSLACRMPLALKAVVEDTNVLKLSQQLQAVGGSASATAALGAEQQRELAAVARFLLLDQQELQARPQSLLPDAWASPASCPLHAAGREVQGAADFWKGCVRMLSTPPSLPQLLQTLYGHTGEVTCCAISADGRLIVSGSRDRTLRGWDVASGELQSTLHGHSMAVRACAITPDGCTVVSGSDDCTVRLWDACTGVLQCTLTGHTGPVRCCSISQDGHTLVSGSADKTLRVWDIGRRELHFMLGPHPEGSMSACTLSPDGRTVISGCDEGKIRVWDLATREVCSTLSGPAAGAGAGAGTGTFALSPDGGTLVVACGNDNELQVWHLGSGKLLHVLQGHGDIVNGVAISPDGSTAASADCSDGTLRVWDLSSGTLRSTLRGHLSGINACAFHPDGRRLVSGSSDNTLRVWDLTASGSLSELPLHGDAVDACAISPDGCTLATVSNDQTLCLWDLALGTLRKSYQGHWCPVAISPDGTTLVSNSGGDAVCVMDLGSGDVRCTLRGHTAYVTCLAITPDSATLVSGSRDKNLRVWDLASGALRKVLRGHTDWVITCAVGPDGTTLVSGCDDGTLRLWDLANLQLRTTLEGHAAAAVTCAISPDGRTLASGSKDQTVRLWDLVTGSLLRSLHSHSSWVQACAFSPDNSVLVSGSYDQQLHVWDLATGELRCTLSGHAAGVLCCAISPDGRVLVSASIDRVVCIWHLTGGGSFATLVGSFGLGQFSLTHRMAPMCGVAMMEISV